VVTAPSPEGPWSNPVDLKISGIDPGHVTGPDGERYLYQDDGYVVELAPTGSPSPASAAESMRDGSIRKTGPSSVFAWNLPS